MTTISPTVFPFAAKYIAPKFPFTLTYGGYVGRTTGSTVDQGASDYFWSLGANSAAGARALAFYGSAVSPESNTYKSFGFPVRCVRIMPAFKYDV